MWLQGVTSDDVSATVTHLDLHHVCVYKTLYEDEDL